MGSLCSYKDELTKSAMPLGQAVHQLSLRAMEGYGKNPFTRELASGTLAKEEFTRYFTSVAPVVYSFNSALASTIPDTDPVRERELRRELLRQMYDEDRHNPMYWEFLRALGVDYLAVYESFEAVTKKPITSGISYLLQRPEEEFKCKLFATDFPDSVAALSIYLQIQVGRHNLRLTSKLAGLLIIELMLCDAVTQIYSGVQRVMRDDTATIKWFTEHRMPLAGEPTTIEQKHLLHGVSRLDEYSKVLDEDARYNALRVAYEIAELYRLVLTEHQRFIRMFDASKYRLK